MLETAINNSGKYSTELIDDDQRKLILIITLVVLCNVFCVLGSVANFINIAVYYKQGLNTTTNISFFALAVSDLCSLIFQLLFDLFVNPLFVALNLPIAYTDVQFLTTAVPREMFARITCLITTFISAERCICVVFPLRVKRIITPMVTTICITTIYISTLITASPLFFTSYYTWSYLSDFNSSLLVLSFTGDHGIAEAVAYFTHALLTLVGFLSVIAFTMILIYKLGEKSEWRRKASYDQEKANNISKRDRSTINMVVLISVILVVCYTPAVMLSLTTFLSSEFSVAGKHYNLYHSMWSLAMLLEVINSSVNIFLYYKMSSKYRRSCNELFSACFCFRKLGASEKHSETGKC